MSSVYFWASTPVYFVSDADAFRVINNERRLFEKEAIELVSGVNIFSNLKGWPRRDTLIGWKDRYLWKEHRIYNGERVEKA